MTTEKVKYGVHSEAGKLKKVMVCSPGLAHQRLTPNNCDELLFDDVLSSQPHPESPTAADAHIVHAIRKQRILFIFLDPFNRCLRI